MTYINDLYFRIWIGRWSLHLENRKAWACQVSLCGNWHIQWQKAWRYCSILPQLWCIAFAYFFCWSFLHSFQYLSMGDAFFFLLNIKARFCWCCSWMLSQVPHVNRTDYQLIDISEDGFVSYFHYTMLKRSLKFFSSNALPKCHVDTKVQSHWASTDLIHIL